MSGVEQKHPSLHSNSSTSNKDWWPEQLNLKILSQHNDKINPTVIAADGNETQQFNYARAFEALDLNVVKKDLLALMTDSKGWWPADYGHYGPFFIRMAWVYSAGKYHTHNNCCGAGTSKHFTPLNSWLDNGNLDKVRQLLWPIKQKYGLSISWADLIILTGNVALESMGFETFGFAGGREDEWEAEDDPNWDHENTRSRGGGGDGCYTKNYDTAISNDKIVASESNEENPLGVVEMGLIYINPKGPDYNSDPLSTAHDIRAIFHRMAMDDEETVSLIAGLHSFRKYQGVGDPSTMGIKPEGLVLKEQELGLGLGLDWRLSVEGDVILSGLVGNRYFEVLFRYKWKLVKTPEGVCQWIPEASPNEDETPEVHDKNEKVPMMLTMDLALVRDKKYERISKIFLERPDKLRLAFSKAWYKMTHRDLGPYARCLGLEVPEPQLWQDLLPPSNHQLIDTEDQTHLKKLLLQTGLSPTRLVATAWASASTFRNTDKRGGANGARIRLAPQKDWLLNEPKELAKVLAALEGIQSVFNNEASVKCGGKRVSMADLIVLGGCAGVEAAAKAAGHSVMVPFMPGRTDATQIATDFESFTNLEPWHDGFRNYLRPDLRGKEGVRADELLIDKAHLLSLTAAEMTVLLGGLRSLGIGTALDADGGGTNICFTNCLSNAFFFSLLDMDTIWTKTSHNLYQGNSRTSGETNIMGTSVDLVFRSHSFLRGLAEVHACLSEGRFVQAFCVAFAKVMDLDRFDLVAAARVCSRRVCDGTDGGMYAAEDRCSSELELPGSPIDAPHVQPILYPWSPQPGLHT